MFCSNCGTPAEKDATFCTKCGAKLMAYVETSSEEPLSLEKTYEKTKTDISDEMTPSTENNVQSDEKPEKKIASPVNESSVQSEYSDSHTNPQSEVCVIPSDIKIKPSQPEIKTQKAVIKEKSHSKILRVILNVVLCLFLCLSIIVSSLVTLAKLCINEDNIKNASSKIHLSTFQIADFITDNDNSAKRSKGSNEHSIIVPNSSLSEIVANKDVSTITDVIYEMVKDQPGWENVKRKNIEEILDGPLVKEFIGDMVDDYIDVIINGESGEGKGLTPENITDFVVENSNEVEKIIKDIGYTEDFKIDETILKDALEENIGYTYAPENITKDFSQYLDILRTLISLPIIIILFWVITAMLIALIIIVNRRYISTALYCIGIPSIIIGFIYVIAWGYIIFVVSAQNELGNLISDVFSKNTIILGTVLALIGLILIAINIISLLIKKHKKSNDIKVEPMRS